MAKALKIILSVILVLLVLSGIVVLTGINDIKNNPSTTSSGSQNTSTGTDYRDTYVTDTNVGLPLLKTAFDGVFFTMSQSGEVKFYELNVDGELGQIEETGSYEVSAACSSQKLPAIIHYIERDGVVDGYGLFTNELYPDVLLFDYGFFRVTNMFSGFSSGDTLLMLIDTDKTRFYKQDKIYSEAFYLYSDHTSKNFLSEDQRQPDMDGKMKSDYKMFTNDILDQGDNSNVLFFSSRYYEDYSEKGYADIFTSGGSGTNVDNVRYAVGIASLNFWRSGSNTFYFANNDDGKSFTLKKTDGKTASDVKTFSGDIDDDYIISGQYILSKSTGEVYNCVTGDTKTIDYSCFKSGFTPDMFVISDNGSYAVVRGASSSGKASCGYVDFESGTVTAYEDDIFAYVATINVTDSGTVAISVSTGESGSGYSQLVAR
jgi:hypothetical protein